MDDAVPRINLIGFVRVDQRGSWPPMALHLSVFHPTAHDETSQRPEASNAPARPSDCNAVAAFPIGTVPLRSFLFLKPALGTPKVASASVEFTQ